MGLWIKLAWRNLWRNKRRSAIELISIGGGVFLAVWYNNLAVGMYQKTVEEGVKTGSGHIGLYHPDYLEQRRTEMGFATPGLVEAVEAVEGVEHASPRLYVPSLLRSGRGSQAGAVLGLDIERERERHPLLAPERYVEGGPPPAAAGRRTLKVAIGAGMADELGIGLGKKLVWMTQGADGQMTSKLMRVAGIFKTGVRELDQSTVVAARAAVGETIGMPDGAHELAIMLPNQDHVAAVLPKLEAIAADRPDLKAYRWQEAMPGLANAIRMDHVGLQITVGLIYLLVGIGTINTMLMSVMERTREFGVIRALGLNRAGVRRMVLIEAVVLGIVGVGVGLLAATGLGLYTSTVGIDLSGLYGDGIELEGVLVEPVIHSTWDLTGMATLSLSMVAIAVVAALYPAYRALKIRPADAMRQI